MRRLLNRNELVGVLESLKASKDSLVFVHHPVTEDLIKAKVVNVYSDTLELAVLEDSPYFGQPNFNVKKIKVVGFNA